MTSHPNLVPGGLGRGRRGARDVDVDYLLIPVMVKPARAAELCSLPYATMRDLIANGRVPSVKIGHNTLVPLRALEDWANAEVGRQQGKKP